MLIKVKLGDAQKFFKITDESLQEFLTAAFVKFGVPFAHGNVKVTDESGTEVDEDVFEEVVKDPSVGVLTIKYSTDLEPGSSQACPVPSNLFLSPSTDTQETITTEASSSSQHVRMDDEDKWLVESALLQKPGGLRIIDEYNRTKTLGDVTRRKMVNILTDDMIEKNGRAAPPRQVREKYARGIISLFPCLSDPFSKNGYEHFYDAESGTGYLAWRIKTVQRSLAKERRASFKASLKHSSEGTSTGIHHPCEPIHEITMNNMEQFMAQISTGHRLSCESPVRRQSEVTAETSDTEDDCKEQGWRDVQRVIVQSLLVKVKLGDSQKFVKINTLSMMDFLTAAFMKFGVPFAHGNVKVMDESGTEVDEDVFEEVVKDPSVGVLTIKYGTDPEPGSSQTRPVPSNLFLSSPTDTPETITTEPSSSSHQTWLCEDAKKLVESALLQKPGGLRIIDEYNRTKSLGDVTRRKMVNILTDDMIEKNGRAAPPRQVREMYARGIISLFPCLSDPFSKNGYEHFYDAESGTGYLAWRIKTMQRSLAKERRASFEASDKLSRRSREVDEHVHEIRMKRLKQFMDQTSTDLQIIQDLAQQQLGFEGPGSSCESSTTLQSRFTSERVLSEEECHEAILFMNHSADEDIINKKMIQTFEFRRKMLLDPLQSCNVLTVFPRFKDIKGLIEQDFVLMFGQDVSGKLVEKWTTSFKRKVIEQCKKLPNTNDVEELLLGAECPAYNSEEGVHFVWDSDLSSILLLLHLLPPSAQGRKRPGKVSASQAERHLVVFKKSGSNVQENLQDINASTEPYLLAVGAHKNSIDHFFIILHHHVIPCTSTSSLGAFDELFKAHFVFGASYNPMLHNMYTFIQTTLYNIDVGKVRESPRVAEVRVRLLS